MNGHEHQAASLTRASLCQSALAWHMPHLLPRVCVCNINTRTHTHTHNINTRTHPHVYTHHITPRTHTHTHLHTPPVYIFSINILHTYTYSALQSYCYHWQRLLKRLIKSLII